MPTKNILVTGGAGYIGSHVCLELSRAGFHPVAYDSLLTGHREMVKWGELEIGDVRDRIRLLEVFHKYRPVAVVHLAALAIVRDSGLLKQDYWDVNVRGTDVLLNVMRSNKCRHCIFSSSGAVYGEPHLSGAKFDESSAPKPINVYGETKRQGEDLFRRYARLNAVNSIAFRFFNVAGADVDLQAGEVHEPETHLIPSLLMAAIGQRVQFSICGVDFPTPDGTAVRDYVHVSDIAESIRVGLQALLREDSGDQLVPQAQIFNLGTGKGYSVREVVSEVQRVVGAGRLHAEVLPRRHGDPSVLVADNTRAKELLNLRFTRSTLEQMIASSLSFMKSRL